MLFIRLGQYGQVSSEQAAKPGVHCSLCGVAWLSPDCSHPEIVTALKKGCLRAHKAVKAILKASLKASLGFLEVSSPLVGTGKHTFCRPVHSLSETAMMSISRHHWDHEPKRTMSTGTFWAHFCCKGHLTYVPLQRKLTSG